MKINTISGYLFVYLLTLCYWNLVVPVRADVEAGDGSVTAPAAGGTETGTKTGIELSLKATAATNEFDYNRSGKTITYTAKDKYAFKSVKTGKNGDIVVWSTDNASEYASKVVLYGKGKKDKIVTIHMSNNSTKSYKKDKNNPWSVYTGPLPSTGNAESSKSSDKVYNSGQFSHNYNPNYLELTQG